MNLQSKENIITTQLITKRKSDNGKTPDQPESAGKYGNLATG